MVHKWVYREITENGDDKGLYTCYLDNGDAQNGIYVKTVFAAVFLCSQLNRYEAIPGSDWEMGLDWSIEDSNVSSNNCDD